MTMLCLMKRSCTSLLISPPDKNLLFRSCRKLSSGTTGIDTQQVEEAGQRAADLAAAEDLGAHPRSHMETLLAHSGVVRQENAPMSPPLHVASTYTRPANGTYTPTDSTYSRHDNPTRVLLEETIGQLECHGGVETAHDNDVVSCCYSSGMAAATNIILAHGADTTVLLPTDVYHGVPTLLADVMKDLNVACTKVDLTNMDALLRETKALSTENIIVWMETPSNPQCQLIDIEEVCNTLKSPDIGGKVTTVVDNTMASPCITLPLRFGADLSFHSGTKYLGGHSDALLGVVTASPWTCRGRELGPKLRSTQIKVGAVASAFDSWLTLRGLRTLHIRVERASQNALTLARYFESHSFVKKTYYPGLETHPQHSIAKKQMKDHFGGVLSIETNTYEQAIALKGALRTVQRATSLGGTETLVEHRASIEPPGRVVSPPGLIRVSVGIEEVSDLISDFKRALRIAEEVTSNC